MRGRSPVGTCGDLEEKKTSYRTKTMSMIRYKLLTVRHSPTSEPLARMTGARFESELFASIEKRSSGVDHGPVGVALHER
jgi:hypothetical protein